MEAVRGVGCVPSPGGEASLNFQVKIAGFLCILIVKNYLGPKTGTGVGLIDSWGAEYVKRMGA